MVRPVSAYGFALLASAVCVTAGCSQTKSANPLSPNIAGPIAGVTITMPKTIEPAPGQVVKDTDQPVRITVENPQTNGVRPVTIVFQIAIDEQFNSIVFSQNGLVPTPDSPTTRVTLPERLQPGRSYFWRARAQDGANSSEWTDPVRFDVQIAIVIGTPIPVSPVNNARIAGLAPELKVRNASTSGPHGPLQYQFQISTDSAFSGIIVDGSSFPSGSGETAFMSPNMPGLDRTFFWRSRITDGVNSGNWSVTEVFRSAATPAPAPLPPVGNGGSCASTNGPAIIACISAKYPERLVAGISLGQRQDNMSFLRDRIIEAGLCAGLTFGYNMKRGGPERSIDFLAWRTGGEDVGVDLAFDYDNTSTTLRLQWAPTGPGAFFASYGAFGGCG
jgi:hypothetical protein